jgi:gliding motility-associated-like protein
VILTVSNGGCEAQDTISVYIKPAPSAGFKMDKDACINEPVQIYPEQTEGRYNWHIDEQTLTDTVYKNQYNFIWNSLGQKNVSLTVTGKNGCASLPYTSSVFIHENPDISITVTSSKICYGDRILLQAPKGDEYQYAWTPATYFESNNRSDVVMKLEHPTTVKLNITSKWGCIATDSMNINSKQCCRVFMPNAFTPDNNGTNDRYKALGKQGHTILTFIILNRWGQTIYRTNDAGDSWDGTYKSVPQDAGTYYYYLKYKCDGNDVYEEKGSFMLIR